MYAVKTRKIGSSLIVVGALGLLLSYQNCARAKFAVDSDAKSTALNEDVFGVDPEVPNNPPTGTDPAVPTKNPMNVTFSYLCSNKQTQDSGSNVLMATALKVVIASSKSSQVACEVQGDFKSQILDKKAMALTPCANLAAGTYVAYIVDAAATSDYVRKSLTDDRIQFAVMANGSYKMLTNKVEILYDLNAENSDYKSMNKSKISTAETQKSCDKNASPLIISMNSKSRGIQLTSPLDGIQFDILGQRSAPVEHQKKQISWLVEGQDYYFITLPKNGVVSGIDEMFGDNTRGPDGKYAANGYAALAKYDDDGDGLITPEDEVYGKLRLWNDENRDGIAQASELHTMAEMKIEIIDLHFDKRYKEQDKYGNETRMKSVVQTEDGQSHLLFDLWFRYLNITK